MSKIGKAPRVPSRQGVELPVLDTALCTGCGRCPQVCPTACLAMGPHYPWLPRPADCVSCALCVLVCPAAALRLEAVS
jgi:formate hydrogenlyase subunit 6/NADH:ubiquinone oxidoreductase subunit I